MLTAKQSVINKSFKLNALLCAVFICIFGFSFPAYNWDIVGYDAAVYKQAGFSGEALSTKVYREIQIDIDSKRIKQVNEFTKISGEAPGPYAAYRYSTYTDSSALEQHIPLYSIKFFYVQLIFILYKLGFTATTASYLISSFFSGLLFFKISRVALKLGVRRPIFVSVMISLGTGLPFLARLSTPDALGAFFVVCLGEAILFKSKSKYAILGILPFIRPDYIILQILYFIGSLWSGKRVHSFSILLGSSVGLLIMNHVVNAYSFQRNLNFLLFDFAILPNALPGDIPINLYMNNLQFSTIAFLTSGIFVIFILQTLLINKIPTGDNLKTDSAIELKLWGAYPILHILMFPSYEFRFFSGVTTLALLVIFARIFPVKIEKKVNNGKQVPEEPLRFVT